MTQEATKTMSNTQDPLYLRKWKEEGIRYLGQNGTGHIDHLDRWKQAFELGFLEGVKSAQQEWELPPGASYIAAVELINEEERE